MISVHARTATTFTANGLAVLDEGIIDPVVTEELGGAFTFEFSYPADGPAAQHLTLEAVVACPVPGMKDRQGFRIHEVTTTLDGLLEITAFHVFYDLSANLIADTFVVNKTAKAALDQILAAANTKHRFAATSADSSTVASARLVRIPVAQALMDAGEDNSFASRWGGEITRDNWHIHHTPQRGADRGVVIRDRKNLTGYESTLDYTTIVTRVLPVGYDGLLLPELYVDSPKLDAYVTPRIRVIRYGQVKAIKDPAKPRDDELPLNQAYAELRRLARQEFTHHRLDQPSATYKVSFADLASTQEYADFAELETVLIGDTVTVRHADLGVALSARVVAYNYNPLTGSYLSVELGSVAAKFTSVTRQIKTVEKVAEGAVEAAGFALVSADGKNTNHYGPTQPEHARLGDTWFKTNGETTEIWIYTTTSTGEPGWVALATDLNHAQVTAELEAARREVAQVAGEVDQAQRRAEEAFNLAASKVGKGEVEQLVKTSANGLNQITLATTNPTRPGKASGDTWWKHAGGQLVGQWIWNDTEWQATRLSHEVIASVDVHSLQVTGTARVSQAVVEKLFADSAHFGVLAANRIVVGDGTNLWTDQDLTMTYPGWTRTPDGAIMRVGTGREEGDYYPWTELVVWPGETYLGSFEFTRSDMSQHIVLRAQRRNAATGEWSNWGDLATAGGWITTLSEPLKVPVDTDRLRFGLFLKAATKPGATVTVRKIMIRRQTPSVLIEDGAITAAKITAGAITATHIKAGAITSDKLTIANGFIQTAMIKDAAITNAKIAHLDAAKITTGTLNANRIGAGSITADKLAANAIQVGLAGWQNSIRISPQAIEWWNGSSLQGRINSSGMHFYYGNTYLGWMGQAGYKNKPDNVRGLNTHLADGASYAAWTTGAGTDKHFVVFTLDPRGTLWPGERGIHLGADLWLDGNSLRTGGKRSISLTDTQIGNRGVHPGLRGPNWLAQVVFQTNDLYLITNGTRYNFTREMTRLQRVTTAVNTLIGYFNQGWIKTIRDTGGGNITWEYFSNTGLGTINIPND